MMPSVRLVVLSPMLLMAAAGCAGFQERMKSSGVGPEREQRQAETLRDFEQRRDAAQLAGALDHWQQGNPALAESMLAGIVNRRPQNTDARLRLAEIVWSRGDATLAEDHLRAVINAEPKRAEAHHTLGLLLDDAGRTEEARLHLANAAELEPSNDIYRLTCESLSPLQ